MAISGDNRGAVENSNQEARSLNDEQDALINWSRSCNIRLDSQLDQVRANYLN
ncbi:hypothetical protein GFY24_18705 [Nocardia sp. SYP-A9097]|nr:hypothetical protein [Nocardia sp. SYP-A9097]